MVIRMKMESTKASLFLFVELFIFKGCICFLANDESAINCGAQVWSICHDNHRISYAPQRLFILVGILNFSTGNRDLSKVGIIQLKETTFRKEKYLEK